MSPTQTPTPKERPTGIPWPPILLVVLCAAAIGLGRHAPLPWPGLDDTAARIVGWLLALAGLGLVIWSGITLHRHNTTVRPDDGASNLVTSGPYALRRNPIYQGDTLILFGVSVLTTNLWFSLASAAFIPLIIWLAILPEERHLERRFGDEWRSYRDSTRRLF